MAGEWRASTWGEEITLEYGKALRDYGKASGKFRVFGSNGPIGWTDKPLASGPGVILGRKGAYRGIEFSLAPFFVIDTAYYVVPKTEFDMRWLYYAIKYHKLGEIDDGSPIPSTTRSAVYVRDFNVPPLAEQKAIAAVLGALDDKIELNRRMNATLEAMARALFQSWFVDFDPVRAKLDGRQSVGLDPATAALFPAFFHETKDGHIPTGWQLGRLADLCNLKRGHDLPTSTRTAGPIPVISSSGTSGTHSETNVRGPGVVTGRYGTIGKVFYIETDYWPLNTTLFVDDFKGNPPRFIFHMLGEVNFQNYTDKAAVPGVNRNHLHEEPMVLPPMELRQAFTHSVSPLWLQHAANKQESRSLAILRDTLLPKLLSGELKVPNLL